MIISLLGREGDFRRAALRVSLVVSVAAILFFATFNLSVGLVSLALAELGIAAFWLYLFRLARTSKKIHQIAFFTSQVTIRWLLSVSFWRS